MRQLAHQKLNQEGRKIERTLKNAVSFSTPSLNPKLSKRNAEILLTTVTPMTTTVTTMAPTTLMIATTTITARISTPPLSKSARNIRDCRFLANAKSVAKKIKITDTDNGAINVQSVKLFHPAKSTIRKTATNLLKNTKFPEKSANIANKLLAEIN